jgi:hypothetical protein
VGLPPSPVEFSSHCLFYKLSCSLLAGHVVLLLPAGVFFTAHMGGGSSPLSCGVFLSPPLSQAFPLLFAGHVPPLPPKPLHSRERFPSPPLWCSGPLCHVSLLFLLLITQFLFFPEWGIGLSRGLCWSGPGLSVEVPRTTYLTLFTSSQSHLDAGVWRPRGPPYFSVQHEVEILCAGWRCGGVKVLPLLGDFAFKVCLQRLSKISL